VVVVGGGTFRQVQRERPISLHFTCAQAKWSGRCSFVWSPREAGAVSLLPATGRDPVPTLHDLPHTISLSCLFIIVPPFRYHRSFISGHLSSGTFAGKCGKGLRMTLIVKGKVSMF
jgi:hypothetical protein